MLYPKLSIFAIVLVLIVFSPCGHPEASAGMATYAWSPLVGAGYDITYPGNQFIPYTTDDGGLVINYDPDNLLASSIDVSTGGAGYSVHAYFDFMVVPLSNGVELSATGDGGQSAFVYLVGSAGALNTEGLPESLGSLVDQEAYVSAHGGYHVQFVFNGQTVPEPSGLLLGVIGLASCSGMWWLRRRSPKTSYGRSPLRTSLG